MRVGEDLRPMSADRLKQIINERVADFSAEFCEAASFTRP